MGEERIMGRNYSQICLREEKILGLEHGGYYFIVVEVHGIYSTIIEV